MPVIEDFLTYLKLQKRYSGHTIAAYQNDLRQFLAFLEAQYEWSDIKKADHHHIRAWMVALLEQKTNPRSIRRKLASLNTYYKYLKKLNLIKTNPLQKVITPKFSKQLPTFIKNNEIETLLQQMDSGNGFAAARDMLVIMMLYLTGIRRAELINIKLDDIDMAQKVVKVTGKGNKQRIIPIHSLLIEHLKTYIEFRKEIINNGENPVSYLIVTNKGKQAYPNLIHRIVSQNLKKVSTSARKSPHVLRHTFAAGLLNSGADLNVIKELLGHSNLLATQVYTHITNDNLKSIYKHAHPRAQ